MIKTPLDRWHHQPDDVGDAVSGRRPGYAAGMNVGNQAVPGDALTTDRALGRVSRPAFGWGRVRALAGRRDYLASRIPTWDRVPRPGTVAATFPCRRLGRPETGVFVVACTTGRSWPRTATRPTEAIVRSRPSAALRFVPKYGRFFAVRNKRLRISVNKSLMRKMIA